MGEPQEATAWPTREETMSGEHVLICVAWPYANGPLHLGHVAGCYSPLTSNTGLNEPWAIMCLWFQLDEHGTPITGTRDTRHHTPGSR